MPVWCLGQTKKKNPQHKPDLTESTPIIPRKKQDTTANTPSIIYETIPSRKPKTVETIEPNYRVKETVIETKPAKGTAPKKNIPIIYDTLKVAKKLREEDIPAAKPTHDSVISMSAKTNVKQQDTIQSEGTCKCVAITIKAQEIIKFEDYINYSFSIVNNCKADVFVHSGSFRFAVVDYFGKPVKRLRKLDFIKRFDHPEFVRLSPGEVYEYRFADDPFFEYELSRGSQYRFSFSYRNTASSYKAAPAKTLMCAESKEVVVTVQ